MHELLIFFLLCGCGVRNVRMHTLMRMTFSWLKWRKILTSRSVRFVSVRCSKALLIFLIATFSPVWLSSAEQTTPYAPCPMGLMSV